MNIRLRRRVCRRRTVDAPGGSDQPRAPRRLPVRLPHGRQRPRQRVRQREVAVQAERPVSTCRSTSTCRRSTTRGRATRRRVRVQGPSRANGAGIRDRPARPGRRRAGCRTTRTSTSTSSVRSRLGTVRFVPSLDVFNVTNNNTIQAMRGTQNATQRQPDAGDRSRRACCASASGSTGNPIDGGHHGPRLFRAGPSGPALFLVIGSLGNLVI